METPLPRNGLGHFEHTLFSVPFNLKDGFSEPIFQKGFEFRMRVDEPQKFLCHPVWRGKHFAGLEDGIPEDLFDQVLFLSRLYFRLLKPDII